VQVYAIIPGEIVYIGSIALCIEQTLAQKIEKDESVDRASFTMDYTEAQLVGKQTSKEGFLSQHYLKHLTEINDRFTKLTDISALYPAVCKFMSQATETAAVILRLDAKSELCTESPEILACHFGDDPDGNQDCDVTNLYLSQRVLESVRSSGRILMAKSARSADTDMVLTVADVHNPRTVICAPISPASETIDLLYIDTPSNHTSSDTFEFVQAVSQQVSLIRKNLLFVKAKSEGEVINRQLSLAKDIQAKMIPRELKNRFGVDVAVSYEPAMWVGGDYYDVWSLDNGQIAFAVGDVSGKGLPAAMIMTNLQAALRTTMNFCTELTTVMQHVNKHLCKNLRDDMFVTFFLGLFDLKENKLEYINAGHLEPIVKHPSGPARFLDGAKNIPLGIIEQPFQMAIETIPAETSLLVVTDGVSETFSPDGEEYGSERLIELINNSQAQTAEEIVQLVNKAVLSFRKSLARQDDTTIFALVNTETPG
jgi:sigma-B regulation protein RsbU (phosphoserine phosphatase)